MRYEGTARRSEMASPAPDGSGRNPQEYGEGVSPLTARTEHSCSKMCNLMEAVVERENMQEALKRVERNKGVAGADEMPVTE